MRRRTEVVSFRAADDLLKQIDAARKTFDISRGDWARSVIQAHVLQSDQQLLHDEIAELREQVLQLADALTALQRTLMKAAYLQLTHGDLSPDEAKDLVRRTLGGGDGRP
jgi:polyhydroxyalkanoate synthesis regulator phasin